MSNNQPGDSNEADTIPSDMKTRVWMGDSWFGSVRCAANMSLTGQHCIMQVKPAQSMFPKSFLDEKMKDFWRYMDYHGRYHRA